MGCRYHRAFFSRGRPPYPLVKDLAAEELEQATLWLDSFQARRSDDCVADLNPIVGCLKEFREQQESGATSFRWPEECDQ